MIAALSLLTGVMLGLGAAATPARGWMCAAATLWVIWRCCSWRRHVSVSLQACAMMLAGLLLASHHVQQWRSQRLSEPGADQRLLVEGRILTVPVRDGAAWRFDLEDSQQRRIRIQWRDSRALPRVGERWQLLLRQLPLEETVNFEGLDTARLAFRDGVHGAGRVLPSAMNAPLRLANLSVDVLRARIATRIRDAIADPDAAALITALAVGLTGSMSAEQWRVFNVTGTTHLVAISGLHVTLFSWLAFLVARAAWRYVPGRRWLDREPFALFCGLAAAGGYSWLAGFSVPTQRTFLMLSLFVLARLCWRPVGGGRLWALAMMLVLVIDPVAPLSAGFWLSFAAVGALLLFMGMNSSEPALQWRPLLRAQWVVMLALAPLSLAVFSGLSLVGLLVNLVAIPLISLVLVPLVLAGALLGGLDSTLAAPFFWLAATLHDLFWPALAWCADLDHALWRVTPATGWFFAAIPAVFVWLCQWPWKLRVTAPCVLLPLLWSSPAAPPPGRAEIHVLDAGRGVAVLVRTRTRVLLFDTGDSWGTRASRLWDIVMPALAQIAPGIDLLLLPALDQDRARSAAWLALDERMDRLVVGGGWRGSVLPVTRCVDTHFRWDDVEFSTFEAGSGRYCLLRVSVPGASLLLAGELDAAAERRLLQRVGKQALSSNAVLVGRRVSASASSQGWIESLSPGLVIATGGITHARARTEVLDRWRRQTKHIVDTRRQGGALLALDADGVHLIATARDARYPFAWRRP